MKNEGEEQVTGDSMERFFKENGRFLSRQWRGGVDPWHGRSPCALGKNDWRLHAVQ